MDICEHVAEHDAYYANPNPADYGFGDWCGSVSIHSPHNGCLGIMCDHGCNAEEF